MTPELNLIIAIGSAVGAAALAFGAMRASMSGLKERVIACEARGEKLEAVKASKSDLDRIDRDKASRESVEGLRVDIARLEAHFDRRFDDLHAALTRREVTGA